MYILRLGLGNSVVAYCIHRDGNCKENEFHQEGLKDSIVATN